jgi:hypothetical protein
MTRWPTVADATVVPSGPTVRWLDKRDAPNDGEAGHRLDRS